jgi:hypothetical protein
VVVFGWGFAKFGGKTWFFDGKNVVKCVVQRGGLQRIFVGEKSDTTSK